MDAAAVIKKSAADGVRQHLGRISCILIPLIMWFAPLPIEPATKHGLAIASFMLIAWIIEPIDHAVTGLIG